MRVVLRKTQRVGIDSLIKQLPYITWTGLLRDCAAVLSLPLCRQPAASQLVYTAWPNGGTDIQHSPLLPGQCRQRALWPLTGHQGQSPELLYGFTWCGRAGRVPRQSPRWDLPEGPEPGLLQHGGQTQEGPAHPQRALQHWQGAAEDHRRIRPHRRTSGGAKHWWAPREADKSTDTEFVSGNKHCLSLFLLSSHTVNSVSIMRGCSNFSL